ncbi:hypothetical protein MCOR25_000267 [Pyricularia grisea]|uniref:Uncharacterized protein n=1 Tax=Pyricularia grisea TaxID=148305 RepID=A0A6P8AQ76_PYRGI|nr:hypothetical protein PgNI_11433 [Pyricularia grisea]KAI6383079.1 hypothetical protein MCOR25_000267 [Pyricularia grisea]TLD04182.1 hypothetical protein PgNI_11433 [Pyricularia grisea]
MAISYLFNLIQKRNCSLKANANEAKDEAKAPLLPKLCLGGKVRFTSSRYSSVEEVLCEISSKAAQPSALATREHAIESSCKR